MTIRTRDLTKQWRPGDGRRLARLLNQAGRAWPGGAWDPRTPEEAERGFHEQQLLAGFVAEVGDDIVSYCNLQAKPDERSRAYIPFLTADPDFLGKGYGKAVLLRAVERVCELGIDRVDLHTWAGNLKAVPLYKKSGFMWSPESGNWGVHMQNFTPGARRHPLAQAFFRKHDWCRTMKRDLSLTEDEHKRGKVRVYEYQWEEDGDRLRMVFDRQSWGLIEIETNDFLVACSLDDEQLIAGLPHRIRWQIVNHRAEPLDVMLMASADEGITLDHKQAIRVASRAQLSADFQVDPKIEEKEKEPRAPIIRTDFLVNDLPVSLAAGFQVKQAVHFSLDGDGQDLRPGRPERIILQGWNETNRPVQARVRVSGALGTAMKQSGVLMRLPARGSAQLPVSIAADQPGAMPLKVEARLKVGKLTVRPKPDDLYAHFLNPGDAIGHVEEHTVVLESAALRLHISRRGGWVNIVDKLRNRWRAAELHPPQIGPPFSWDEFFQRPCRARVEHHPGRAEAVLTTTSDYRPGIRLERRIILTNLPLIEVRDILINASETELTCRHRTRASLRAGGGTLAVPTADGIIRGLTEGGGRPLAEHNLSEDDADWPEGWIAAEDVDGITTGLIWGRAHRVGSAYRYYVEQELAAAAPGQSTSADPVHIFVGEGDYFTVRQWWQTLHGERTSRPQRHPETRQPLQFGLRPRPLVLHGAEVAAKLAAESVGRLELDGELSVRAPAGRRVRPAKVPFQRVSGKRSRSKPVTVTRRASLPDGGYFVDCTARIDRAIYRERQPIIVMGDPAARVTVSRAGDHRDLLRIDNGVLALTIAPNFHGSAVALQRGREQLLRSSYPEARPLGWQNPWLGGLTPTLGSLGRTLHKEKFTARKIERRGRQGLTWRGVRVSCSPKQDDGRHDTLSLDYLLAPGSHIFAVVVRTTRRADSPGWIEGGFELWPLLGGSHLEALLTGQLDSRASRLRGEFGGSVCGDRWVIAENRKAAEAVLVACPGGDAGTRGRVLGADGYLLTGGQDATQEARETRASVFFIAFTSAELARDSAQALSQLEELP